MDTKQQSNFGEWAFLAGALALVGGWLGYESIDAINAWLATVQTATPTTDGDMGAWLASNWGLVALIAATIFAALKWAVTQRSGASGIDGGAAVTYRRYRFVSVRLVR